MYCLCGWTAQPHNNKHSITLQADGSARSLCDKLLECSVDTLLTDWLTDAIDSDEMDSTSPLSNKINLLFAVYACTKTPLSIWCSLSKSDACDYLNVDPAAAAAAAAEYQTQMPLWYRPGLSDAHSINHAGNKINIRSDELN